LGAKLSVILDQHLPKAPPGADAVVIEMRKEITDILSGEPNLKLQEIADKMNRDKRMVQAVLRVLADENLVECEGKTKAAKWRLIG
jgi:hypothetical protein